MESKSDTCSVEDEILKEALGIFETVIQKAILLWIEQVDAEKLLGCLQQSEKIYLRNTARLSEVLFDNALGMELWNNEKARESILHQTVREMIAKKKSQLWKFIQEKNRG